ncbi:methyl-accepting chemotaxis protein [Undibacterium sp. MH2W]|uniref:methyl-accepting chemotaxis protein n=1 Tax=Undibacterium sp. MH2W TaxID=3413044 RepID=UPI003BF341F8
MSISEKLQQLSISRRLQLLIASAVIGILLLTALFLASEKKMILEERQANVQQTVETAAKVVSHYYDLASQHQMSEADAKQAAMDTVKALRYGDNGYFWINDMQPVMLMHPIKAELVGKNLANFKDPEGKLLYMEMLDVVKSKGSGFVFHVWTKPGSSAPVPKVSYVKGFAPWGWIIASGVYIDGVDASFHARLLTASVYTLVLAAVLIGVSIFIARSLIVQLGGEPSYASAVTKDIAAGKLTGDIILKQNDTTSLLASIKMMRDEIADLIRQIKTGAETISHASKEIASGNLDLSARTESQAGSLEETASTMEELTSTVRQNADNARQARQLASSASDVAIKGSSVVSEVVATMEVINASSQKIVDIISVIDGIAFQTNILALNAAVEAARAGEQGRGFAVVATEVRNLAQRSALAAKEIKTLINDSVDNVGHGTRLVDAAGKTMEAILESVKKVNDVISEITAATGEQSTGIEQVNLAIIEMDNATQQNAALVEQAAAAAASMEEQAGHLMAAVGMFDLGHDVTTQASTAATSVKPAVRTSSRPTPSNRPAQQITNQTARKSRVNQESTADQWEEF